MAFMALSPSMADGPRFRERSVVSYMALGSSELDDPKPERALKTGCWCCSTSSPGIGGTVTGKGTVWDIEFDDIRQ